MFSLSHCTKSPSFCNIYCLCINSAVLYIYKVFFKISSENKIFLIKDKAASGEEKQHEQAWDECCFIPLHIFIATYKHISFAWLPARLLSSISSKHPRKNPHTRASCHPLITDTLLKTTHCRWYNVCRVTEKVLTILYY